MNSASDGTPISSSDERTSSALTSLDLRCSSSDRRSPADASTIAVGTTVYGLPGRKPANARQSASNSDAGSLAAALVSSVCPPLAAGRGRARTFPAWMTAGPSNAVVPVGLQQHKPPGRDAKTEESRKAVGLRPSRRHQGAQSQLQTDPNHVTIIDITKEETNENESKNKKSNKDKAQTTNLCSNHAGRADKRGDKPPRAQQLAGKSSRKVCAPARSLREQQLAPLLRAGVSSTEHAQTTVSLPNKTLSAAGRGLENTHPSWMNRGVKNEVGGLQQQGPFGRISAASVALSVGMLSPHALQQCFQIGQQGNPKSGGTIIRDPVEQVISTNGAHEQPQAVGMGTLRVGRVDLRGSDVAPDRMPGETVSVTRVAFNPKQTTGGPEGLGSSIKVWSAKRDRDEGPAVARRNNVLGAQGNASGQQTTGLVGMAGITSWKTREGLGPLSKKNKVDVAGNSPSQDRAATKTRGKILENRSVSSQGLPTVSGSSAQPLSPTSDTRRGATKYSCSPSFPPGGAPLPSEPSPVANERLAGPPLVVIDGEDAAVTYREDGEWSARGPLLAIEFFEQLGLRCVVFLHHDHDTVHAVSPDDESYAPFWNARSTGTISTVPPTTKKASGRGLFILKHAIDKGALVISNRDFTGHLVCDANLAVLGQTTEELKAFLSGHQVPFKISGEDFLPDPKASLDRILAQQTTAEKRVKRAFCKGGGSTWSRTPLLLAASSISIGQRVGPSPTNVEAQHLRFLQGFQERQDAVTHGRLKREVK